MGYLEYKQKWWTLTNSEKIKQNETEKWEQEIIAKYLVAHSEIERTFG